MTALLCPRCGGSNLRQDGEGYLCVSQVVTGWTHVPPSVTGGGFHQHPVRGVCGHRFKRDEARQQEADPLARQDEASRRLIDDFLARVKDLPGEEFVTGRRETLQEGEKRGFGRRIAAAWQQGDWGSRNADELRYEYLHEPAHLIATESFSSSADVFVTIEHRVFVLASGIVALDGTPEGLMPASASKWERVMTVEEPFVAWRPRPTFIRNPAEPGLLPFTKWSRTDRQLTIRTTMHTGEADATLDWLSSALDAYVDGAPSMKHHHSR